MNSDGNEVSGVPSVLFQAPLGTYTGWNIIATGVYKGQQCNLSGSYYPFKETKAERVAAKDPRPSLEKKVRHARRLCVRGDCGSQQECSQRFLRATACNYADLASPGVERADRHHADTG